MIHFIDDDELLRELLHLVLSDANYESIGFDSGEKYLDYLNSPDYKNPIIVLSDVTMPGMNGYDLALKIREKHPLQKIALITGNAANTYHARAASQLCFTLDKPYSPNDLIILLESFFSCENNHRLNDRKRYVQHCEFGIDHDCPFHISKQLHEQLLYCINDLPLNADSIPRKEPQKDPCTKQKEPPEGSS